MAVIGPLALKLIQYRSLDVINNQLIGQDLVNPVFLIYYALSYTIGWEWSFPIYTGNNEKCTFFFLFVLVGALIILLYSLAFFPRNFTSHFRKNGLTLYSFIFCLFLLIFAAMWAKEILDLIRTDTARGYDISPTGFWLVRIFDLAFSIPLGLISIYLLWSRPDKAFPVICFCGFFLTQILAANAMGWMMFIRRDPAFALRDLIVFSALALIIVFGFFYVPRHYQFFYKCSGCGEILRPKQGDC